VFRVRGVVGHEDVNGGRRTADAYHFRMTNTESAWSGEKIAESISPARGGGNVVYHM
jgi:hypothetical protein